MHGRQHEAAAAELLGLMRHFHENHGQLGGLGGSLEPQPGAEEQDAHFAARIASAVSALFADPEFRLSAEGFMSFLPCQQWFGTIFGASTFGNADHVIDLLGAGEESGRSSSTDAFLKSCLLHSLDSQVALDPEQLWTRSRAIAASFMLALLSSRLVLSATAHEKRERLLGWLAPRLTELSLDDLPSDLLLLVWMHCSYAIRADKHAIKKGLNALVRSKLAACGIADLPCAVPRRGRPVVLCVVEWFFSGHPIYRTHSLSLEALKARYRVIGVSLRGASDELARRVFEETHVMPADLPALECVRRVHGLAARLAPDVVYYPSIGMFREAIFLANLRLAPLQVMGLGHPATSHSPFIDCAIVEQDYLGDPACFSERVVAVPPGAMPYRELPEGAIGARPRSPGPVRIAIAASGMKLNAVFLGALQAAARRSKVLLEFRFFAGGILGLAKLHLSNAVKAVLGDAAVVFPHLPRSEYLEGIGRCDLFVNPFPFGNTNGTIDTVSQGLPGVCLSGPEVHSHIDGALFRRLGLPEWLIAQSIDDYVAAMLRLSEDSHERGELRRRILDGGPHRALLEGRPELFGEVLHAVQAAHEAARPL